MNTAASSNPTDPLIGMVTRDTNGALSFHTYSTKANGNTRPILLIDQGNPGLSSDDQVYIFVTDNEGGGRICYKTSAITTPLSAMTFLPGDCGTAFIADAAIDQINNSTSTKQNVNNTTGIVVVASDEPNGQFYVHNVLGDPPPVVTARSPAFDATDVPVNAVVSVTFSKAMNASTLTTANFSVADSSGPVAGTLAYDGATRAANFTPATLWRANTTYTVTLSGGISDTSGQPLYASVSNVWNFTTEPPTAQFSGAAYSVGEGAGTTTITVTLNTSSTTSVTVNYATSPGTATAGTDYADVSGTLTFTPGQTSRTFTVPITDDGVGTGLDELNEMVNLALSVPGSATLGTPNAGTLTIVDDDGTPTVQFDLEAVSANEGDGGKTIHVTLSNPSVFTLTVDYAATPGGTATPGLDYTAIPTTLTFAPLQTSQTFTVTVLEDALDETNETMFLALSNPSPSISVTLGAPSIATLMIVDNDPMPTVQFSSSAYSVNEGGGTATMTVTLSGPAAFTVTVGYVTANGTALAGSDYVTATGTLTFTPGQTSRTFTVSILNDALDEANEVLNATLSNPTVQFSSSAYSVDESGGTATITLTLSLPSGQTVSVDYATGDGTAMAGPSGDYTGTGGTLTFAPLQTSQMFTVTLLDDMLDESNEFLNLTLTNPADATLGTPGSATLTILDNDPLPPYIVYLPLIHRNP